eukprot:1540634-Rhodomonas_salina.1
MSEAGPGAFSPLNVRPQRQTRTRKRCSSCSTPPRCRIIASEALSTLTHTHVAIDAQAMWLKQAEQNKGGQ